MHMQGDDWSCKARTLVASGERITAIMSTEMAMIIGRGKDKVCSGLRTNEPAEQYCVSTRELTWEESESERGQVTINTNTQL